MRELGMLALGTALLVFAACSRAPAREGAAMHRAPGEPRDVVDAFARRLPDPLHVVNAATFELGWTTMVVLGVTTVNAARSSFAVVGLHPAGSVKLFEVAGDRESIQHRFAQPSLLERGDLPSAVAEDTRRIYLDRIPSPEATWWRDEDGVRFRQPHGEGELEYTFGGSDGVLLEKAYIENERKVWTVRYRNYLERGGVLYPKAIVLEHHEYGYRLTLRLKEILS
jgi:hypothetical protein